MTALWIRWATLAPGQRSDKWIFGVVPLILAWSVSPHLERKPRPAGELERDWAEFVRRTGFPHRH